MERNFIKTMNKKKILIVGSNGFIGSFLLESLKGDYLIKALSKSNNLTEESFIKVDLSDLNDVEKTVVKIPKCDVMIFLVGLAHKKGRNKDLQHFRKINKNTLEYLLQLLENKKKVPKQLIFSSTVSVYGERLNKTIYDENSNVFPVSPYAKTKYEAEQFLLKKYIEKTWILRFAPVYSEEFQLNIIRRTILLGQYYKIGNGTTKLSLCNIKNIDVVIRAIIDGKVPFGVYNVSDQKVYSYNDLLRYVRAKKIRRIPSIFLKILYFFGKYFRNLFFIENTIKLLSDNIYSSEKIKKFIKPSYVLENEK